VSACSLELALYHSDYDLFANFLADKVPHQSNLTALGKGSKYTCLAIFHFA
jgi:hypothetical protein